MTLIKDNALKNSKAMNSTLNSQLPTLNSRSYSPPQITIVDFKVELGIINSKLEIAGSRLYSRDDIYYSTGDTYSEITSDDGQFEMGRWQ
jgi:hypothetical protein